MASSLLGLAACACLSRTAVLTAPAPPSPPTAAGNTRVKYGMPSSHAQFVTFFAVYFLLVCIRCVAFRPSSLASHDTAPRPTHTHPPSRANPRSIKPRSKPLWLARTAQLAVAVGVLASAALVCGGRVYLGYHTERQVLAGMAVGAAAALVWRRVVLALRPLLAWFSATPLAQALYIRVRRPARVLCARR